MIALDFIRVLNLEVIADWTQNYWELLEQIAKAIAAQFGSNCEVVLHELSGKSAYSSIVAIENGT